MANRVERGRLRMGVGKTKAAELAGIAPATWRRIEDGRPVHDISLAAALKLVEGAHATTAAGTAEDASVRPRSGSISFLVEARRKFQNREPLDEREMDVLARFIEDQELSTLSDRMGKLTREHLLAVSEQVDELLGVQVLADAIAEASDDPEPVMPRDLGSGDDSGSGPGDRWRAARPPDDERTE